MADGVAENYTAAMLEPYLDAVGRLNRATAGSASSIRSSSRVTSPASTRLGFQVHLHALGDRAVREALDAIEAARAANGPSDGRHHLAHLQVVDPADYGRFRAARRIGANIQPYWACNDAQMAELTLPFLPPDRRRPPVPVPLAPGRRRAAGRRLRLVGQHAQRDGRDRGRRQPHLARASGRTNRSCPPKRIDLPSALAAFTNGSAWVNHRDHDTGSIEPGKLADLVVLDRDIARMDPRTLGDARVVATLIEGVPVHEDPALERP